MCGSYKVGLFVDDCSLTRPEVIEELVNLITQEPSEDTEEVVRYKSVFPTFFYYIGWATLGPMIINFVEDL